MKGGPSHKSYVITYDLFVLPIKASKFMWQRYRCVQNLVRVENMPAEVMFLHHMLLHMIYSLGPLFIREKLLK